MLTDRITVKLIDSMVSDEAVVRAARVSTMGAASLEDNEGKAGLINYLMKNRHGSPFEHGMFTFYIDVPIFVAREWMRHRAGWSYNETSGRYKEMESRFYYPSPDRQLVQVGKTGAYEFELGTEQQYDVVVDNLTDVAEFCWDRYQDMLRQGIAKEVARMVLPLNTMTSFYATCNPRSLMHFLSLRTERSVWEAAYPSKPMAEIAMAAEQMEAIFATLMPSTYASWSDNKRVCP